MKSLLATLWRAAFAAGFMIGPAISQETITSGCAAFSGNIQDELRLMGAAPSPVTAAGAGERLPGLRIARHYLITLVPQGEVKFYLEPARPVRGAAPRAGVLAFKVRQAGRYRVSLTSSHWIDVLDGARVIDSVTHEGKPGCQLLHKIVEFDLPANRPLTLQLSGRDDAIIGLAITRSPARTPLTHEPVISKQ